MLNFNDNRIESEQHDEMIEEICSIENLHAAWRKVRANRGVGGVDLVSIQDFERNLRDNLTELSRNLLNGTYQPLPARFVNITKANGKTRELGILTVRDRVAQRAVLDAVEPAFEAEMQDCSYAFRAGRNVEMAIQQILVSRANGFLWTVESDIKHYFPSIDRHILLDDVGRIVTDEAVIDLIALWLDSGILNDAWWQTGSRGISELAAYVQEILAENLDEVATQRTPFGLEKLDVPAGFEPPAYASVFEDEAGKDLNRKEATKSLLKDGFWLAVSHRAILARVIGTKLLGFGGVAAAGIFLAPRIIEAYREFFHPRKGILQGSPISPVLANIYLNEFDRSFLGGDNKPVRYCDDFVIQCRTESAARKALKWSQSLLARRGLVLHPDKTRIVPPNGEFEFLGYRFLSDGRIEPPRTATRESARNIMELAARTVKNLGIPKLNVTKLTLSSWKDYFHLFGKRN